MWTDKIYFINACKGNQYSYKMVFSVFSKRVPWFHWKADLLFWRCSSTINVFQGKMVKSRVKIKNEDEDEDEDEDEAQQSD